MRMKDRLRPVWSLALCLVVLGAWSPEILAQSYSAERAQQLYLEGMSLYKGGKYLAAAGRFEEAYRLFADPRLIYNIARSYEATGELLQAMRDYLRCVDDPTTTKELRQKALRRVRLIETARRQSEAVAPEPPRPLPSVAPSSPAVVGQPEQGSTPAWIGTAKWIGGALGIGLLGGGGVLMALGLADESELDDARTAGGQVSSLTRAEAADLVSRAESKQTSGAILLGAGAVFTVAAAVLFAMDAGVRFSGATSGVSGRRSEPETRWALAPMADGRGLLFAREF